MTPDEAKAIIDALADGFDPETGEEIDKDNILSRAQVVRALFVASKALDQMVKREVCRGTLQANVGRAWAEDEDNKLLAEFDEGLSINDIAVAHGRTKGAITSRLARFGRVTNPVQHRNGI